MCAQRRLRSDWASESSLCAQWVAKDPRCRHADSEDSDQTGSTVVKTTGNGELKESETPKFLIGIPLMVTGFYCNDFLFLIQLN